jgi:hypothetical protein
VSNRRKTKQNPHLPATVPGPKPGDFPAGSVRSRAAARAIIDTHAAEQRKIEEAEFSNLTPLEAAFCEGRTGLKKLVALGIAQMLEERARIFQLSLPTPDEIRHGRALAKEIERMTDGEGLSLCNSNPAEWNRLRAIAEENLKAKAR